MSFLDGIFPVSPAVPLPSSAQRWRWHLAGVLLFAFAIGLLFLQAPNFGDDFTYWSFSSDVHERGLRAWKEPSFHELRWPVWGICWLIQAAGGQGVASYYGVPLIYLAAGAALTFAFGRMLTGSPRASWAMAIVFLFQPLLDTVCYRPMPDLPEGVWGAAAILLWWRLMQASSPGRSAGWMAALGATLFLAESNRLTGVFIVVVVFLLTLLAHRRRIGWLVGAFGVAAALYFAEAAFYHSLFHDWWHSVHANLGARGKHGTEAIALWRLPFRFLYVLWSLSPISKVLAVLTLLGLPVAWRHRSPADEGPGRATLPLARVMILWAVLLYLAYSCAPQSLWPWRPMLRDADRFLAGLTVPLSVLAVFGLRTVLEWRPVRARRWGKWPAEQPLATGLVAVALLVLVSARPLFDLGYLPQMRKYVRACPDGTRVFTHDLMRFLAILCEPTSRDRLHWRHMSQILESSEKSEALATGAQEFWYMRKIVWLAPRKRAENKRNGEDSLRPVGSYFIETDQQWALARLLVKGNDPDLIFYRRRTPEMPPAAVLPPTAPELGDLFPALPFNWTRSDPFLYEKHWIIPASLRGQCLSVETEAASNEVQAVNVTLTYSTGAFHHREILLKPYFYPQLSKDFFVIPIPATAESCEITVRVIPSTKTVLLNKLRIVAQTPLDGPAE